jgi:hypothetical protein
MRPVIADDCRSTHRSPQKARRCRCAAH